MQAFLEEIEGDLQAMKTMKDDDILRLRVSDKPIAREISQGWNTNVSYAEDGSIVEIVLLDAKKEGLLPVELKRAV